MMIPVSIPFRMCQRAALLALALLSLAAATSAEAQGLGALKRKLKEKAVGAAGSKPVGDDAAPERPVNRSGPTFSDSLLEITPAVLDRFLAAADEVRRAEALLDEEEEWAALAREKERVKWEAYDKCVSEETEKAGFTADNMMLASLRAAMRGEAAMAAARDSMNRAYDAALATAVRKCGEPPAGSATAKALQDRKYDRCLASVPGTAPLLEDLEEARSAQNEAEARRLQRSLDERGMAKCGPSPERIREEAYAAEQQRQEERRRATRRVGRFTEQQYEVLERRIRGYISVHWKSDPRDLVRQGELSAAELKLLEARRSELIAKLGGSTG
ncbi:MAG: hypothetical protein ABR499_13020 [Gemmatimonadaceae bacterium]